MLRIEHFTKCYGDKKAVDDLSLHIAPGEIFGFIGHNGAGKTTTLKACCGILRFDQGEILIDGKSIRTDPIGCKRELAYVPDNPDLYEFLTGIQYLNFVADIYGVSGQDRAERIRYYGGLLGMTDDLTLPISECGSGAGGSHVHAVWPSGTGILCPGAGLAVLFHGGFAGTDTFRLRRRLYDAESAV